MVDGPFSFEVAPVQEVVENRDSPIGLEIGQCNSVQTYLVGLDYLLSHDHDHGHDHLISSPAGILIPNLVSFPDETNPSTH